MACPQRNENQSDNTKELLATDRVRSAISAFWRQLASVNTITSVTLGTFPTRICAMIFRRSFRSPIVSLPKLAHATACAGLIIATWACEARPKTDEPGPGEASPTSEEETHSAAAQANTKTEQSIGPDWSVTVTHTESAGPNVHLDVTPPGSTSPTPLSTNTLQTLRAGSTLQTDARTRAKLRLEGLGHVVLDHSSTLRLDPERKDTVHLVSGRAVFAMPRGADPLDIVLPTATVRASGAKLSAVANPRRSTVTVSKGEIATISSSGTSTTIYAGQEAVLLPESTPIVRSAANLGTALSWGALEDRSVEIPRGMGSLTAKRPGRSTEQPLVMERHSVEVTIQGVMARTEITEVFRNETKHTLEGIYKFPLPSDAQISRLALLVDNKVMEGEFVERERADKIWRGVIRNATPESKRKKEDVIWVPGPWKDPALLKWEQGNQFELRIFPIEPRSSRQVTIAYTQRLSPSAGGRDYVYPMPVDINGDVKAEHFDFNVAVHGLSTSSTVAVDGYDATIARPNPDVATASVSSSPFVAAGDLRVRLLDGEERELRAAGFRDATRPQENGYVTLTLRPNLPKVAHVGARDLVVIVDTSYSRGGVAMTKQAELVKRLISELDYRDRVALLTCAHTCSPLGAPGLTEAQSLRADDLAESLTNLPASGATNLVEAVRVAKATLDSAGARDGRIIYITDGVASVGEIAPGALSTTVRNTLGNTAHRLTVVDLGGDGDALALNALAIGGRGPVVRIQPDRTLTEEALRILGIQYGAMLTEATLSLPPGLVQVYPETLPALPAGDELTIVARVQDPGANALGGEIALTR